MNCVVQWYEAKQFACQFHSSLLIEEGCESSGVLASFISGSGWEHWMVIMDPLTVAPTCLSPPCSHPYLFCWLPPPTLQCLNISSLSTPVISKGCVTSDLMCCESGRSVPRKMILCQYKIWSTEPCHRACGVPRGSRHLGSGDQWKLTLPTLFYHRISRLHTRRSGPGWASPAWQDCVHGLLICPTFSGISEECCQF